MDNKQKRQKLINNSKLSRITIISFFLIFAAVAFFFTFNSKEHSIPSLDKDIALEYGKESYVNHTLTQKSVSDDGKQPETIQNSLYIKTMQHWDGIIVKYYKGRDVLEELIDFTVLINDQTTKVKMHKLINQIRAFGPYRPVHIYQEFVKLKKAYAARSSLVKFGGGIFSELFHRYVKINKVSEQSDFMKSLLSIEDLIVSQEYKNAYVAILSLQQKCDKCINSYDFTQLARQNDIDFVVESIGKDIKLIKK